MIAHSLPRSDVVQDLDSIASAATSSPTLFFVGSGVSVAPPACLPSAWNMIKLVVDELSPLDATTAEKTAICDALPELFYQGLFGLIGLAATEPWTVLTLYEREPDAFPRPIKPTAAHLVIVFLSWKYNLPIITTNFDRFFEFAAQLLGLQAVVSVPSGRRIYQYASAGSREVAVWKVHGSADNPHSICTTLKQISVLNTALVSELQQLFGTHQSCLVGYSGRDIDLFPFIASFELPRERRPFWLCKEFPDNHGIYARPDRFLAVQGDAQDFAYTALERMKGKGTILGDLRNRVEEQRGLTPQAERIRRENLDVYLRHGVHLVRERLVPILDANGRIGNRSLLHAVSLGNVQRFRWAAEHAERYVAAASPLADARGIARACILLSSCYHNLSKYDSAQRAAEDAYEISHVHRFREEEIDAIAQRDEARRMQLYPNLPVRQSWFSVRVLRYALLMGTFAFDLFRMERLIQSLTNDEDSQLAQSRRHVALEHRVRLYAMLQGVVVSTLGSRLAVRLFKQRWVWIRRESYRVGYAAGIANALRYQDRLSRPSELREENREVGATEIASSIAVYQFMNHRNGLALALRDQADALLAQGSSDQAAKLYARCVALARADENASVELKGLLGLRRCGKRIDSTRVEYLLANIEGDGYRQLRKTLMRFVAD